MKGIETIMQETGQKRNKVINDAIAEYIKHKKLEEWPDEIKNFDGIEEIENWDGFEASRVELKNPRELIFSDQ